MKPLNSEYNKLTYLILILQLIVTCYLFFELRNAKKSFRRFQQKSLVYLRRQENLAYELQLAFEQTFKTFQLPEQLKHIPFADEQGIVLSVRDVEIPGVVAPHNGSILKDEGRYLLFFRYDTPVLDDGEVPFHTHIGCVDLDENFSPFAPFWTVDTKSSFSEDPRAVKVDGQYYLTFSDPVPENPKKRGVRLAHIEPKDQQVHSITTFPRRLFSEEKNWLPFSLDGKTLNLIYTISPHEILQLPSLTPTVDPEAQIKLSSNDWPERWGDLRCGTPPQLVDGEYLSFFHSSFKDSKEIVWYIMGAYTFEPTFPFRITKISSCPLLFKGVFETPHQNTSNKKVRCIYPAGFVLEKREGKEVIQLSCGENDSAIKLVTIDKDRLICSMKPVSASTGEKPKKTPFKRLSARSKNLK